MGIQDYVADSENGFVSIADTLQAIRAATGISEADAAKALCLMIERDEIAGFTVWTMQGPLPLSGVSEASQQRLLGQLASLAVDGHATDDMRAAFRAGGFEARTTFAALHALDARIVLDRARTCAEAAEKSAEAPTSLAPDGGSLENESVTNPSPRLRAATREIADSICDEMRSGGMQQTTARGIAKDVARRLTERGLKTRDGAVSESSVRKLLKGWSYSYAKGR